jgi:hypothetical protein
LNSAQNARNKKGETKMKSSDIRRKLQQFADFAPAILAVAEICESAEKGEAQLAQLSKEQAQRESELDQLNVSIGKSRS